MTKKLKHATRVDTVLKDEPDNFVVIVFTQDDVKYYFKIVTERVSTGVFRNMEIRKAKFSHRFDHRKPKGNKRTTNNHPLPDCVSKFINEKYDKLEMMDGGMEVAEVNMNIS